MSSKVIDERRRLLQGYSPLAMTTKANAVPKRLRFGMAEPTSHAPANDNFLSRLSSVAAQRRSLV